jgi:hypothetical protein
VVDIWRRREKETGGEGEDPVPLTHGNYTFSLCHQPIQFSFSSSTFLNSTTTNFFIFIFEIERNYQT